MEISAIIAMIACVLDPQFKKLRFTSEIIKIQIYEELRGIYNEEKENQMVILNLFNKLLIILFLILI